MIHGKKMDAGVLKHHEDKLLQQARDIKQVEKAGLPLSPRQKDELNLIALIINLTLRGQELEKRLGIEPKE